MQHLGAIRIFFKILTTVTFVYNHIQCLTTTNFKRESKNTTYKVLCPFWDKMSHFDYHQGQIFVPDNSQNGAFYSRMGLKPSMLCYDSNPCLFKCSPRLWAPKKNCFHYDQKIIMAVSATISILQITEWLKSVSWKQFELTVLESLKH